MKREASSVKEFSLSRVMPQLVDKSLKVARRTAHAGMNARGSAFPPALADALLSAPSALVSPGMVILEFTY